MRFVEFRDVPLADIQVGPRLRQVDPDWAEALAAMFAQAGMQHPPAVFEAGATRYTLIFGAHRLAAAKICGWEKMTVKVMAPETENIALEVRLHEIVENVGRRELSALDRATHLAELKRVYEELHPETRRGVSGGKARQNSASEIFSFAEDAARKCGLTVRSIQLAVALHEGLTPETRDLLRDTPLADNAAELRRLAKLGAELQREVASKVAAGRAKRLRDVVAPASNPSPNDFEALMKAWKRAGAKARRRFLDEIGASLPEEA